METVFMPEQLFPEPTVGGLIFDPDDRLLVVKSHKWRDKYVIPGGHIELGESMEQALKREIKEETNLDIHDIDFLGFQEFIFDTNFWKKRHFIFFDFVCRTDSTNVKLDDEAQEFLWASVQDALKLPLEPYTEHAIHQYLRKRKA